MRALALALALAPLATMPSSAEADPPAPTASVEVRARAKEQSDRGRRFYELGEYDRAIAAYREAYMILPSPGVLFNLGQAHRLKGDCVAAASSYRGFLRTEPEGPPRRLAEAQLADVEKCAREAPPRFTSSASGGRSLRGAGLAAAVGGGVLLGAGMYFAIDSGRASSEVERHYAGGGRWADIAGTDARGKRSSDYAIALGASGGAALATGTVLYLLGVRSDRAATEPKVWVTPAASSTQVGVSWAW